MKREVQTGDVCGRELPLRGIKGQTVRRVSRAWHWPGRRPEPWEPEDICTECWGAMAEAAREARAIRDSLSEHELGELSAS